MRYKTLTLLFVISMLMIWLNCAFGEDFIFVDLEPYANSKILDTNWWTGEAGNTDMEELLEIAQDGHTFVGPGDEEVPFKIVDAVLNIFGTNAANNPEKIEGIEIGMAAESIYFVHMTGWEAVGMPSYKFVINFEGGSSEELLMESNVNSDNWDQVPAPLADENSAWIWEETAVTVARGGVIATKWENPDPEKRILTVDFVSLNTAAVPALFAITLGGASATVCPDGKMPGLWSQIKIFE